MAAWWGWAPLAVTALLYLGQAALYLWRGELGMALAFFSYALANVGFIAAWLRN